MICPHCKKEFLSLEKVCPYCGKAIEEEEKAEVAEEVAEEVTEEVTEEETEEATEEETEEATEEVAEEETEEETEEVTEEVAEEYDPEAMQKVIEAAADAQKKSNTAVKVLLALIAISVVIIVALVAKLITDKEEIPAETTEQITTTDVADATGTADVAEPATPTNTVLPFDGKYSDGAELNYPDGFDYKNTDVSQYVTLGNYKGQTLTVTMPLEMSDEEFEDLINYFLSQYATLGDAVTDRAAALGDSVVIDYVGSVDGVAFEGGTDEGAVLVLGSDTFIPGFEDGVVGMSIGDVKDIAVTFPTNYHAPDLAGKEAVFKVTLHSITERVIPELTDDFVVENFGMASVDEFKSELRAMHTEEAKSERYSMVLEMAAEGATVISFPEGAVDDYVRQQVASDTSAAAYYSMSVYDYITGYYGMDMATYEKEVLAMAEGMVTQELVLYAIAKAEGITVSEEELAAEAGSFLEYYGQTDIEALCTSMGVSEELLNNSFHFSVIYNKVLDIIVENTTFIVVE